MQTLIGSMTAAENATDRLANAQARYNLVASRMPAVGPVSQRLQTQLDVAGRRLAIAQRNAMREMFQEAATEAQPFLNVLAKLEKVSAHLVETFRAFGHELLDIQGITGAGRGEIAGAMGLLGGAGIRDRSAIKMLLGLNQAAFGNEGLAMLGIIPRQGQSSIDVLNQIINKLATIQDGFYKTNAEVRTFGEENVEAIQPLLRMSQGTRDQLQRFSEGLGDGAEQAQKLDEASAKLQAGWQAAEIRVGRPLAVILTIIEEGLVTILDAWDKLDKKLHGAASGFLVFVGIAAGIISTVAAIGFLMQALQGLLTVLGIVITREAIIDALAGNWAAIAAAGVIAAGATYYVNQSSGDNQSFHNSVGQFGAAVNQFTSNIDQYKAMYMPSSLTDYDIARLSSQMAQGSIG